ncbi:hypothetical protein KY327_02900 [Candidatus Woesearchaeota archaeon]|nr:hypothetical protein [Candidatus Woesearchaeota archaeon]
MRRTIIVMAMVLALTLTGCSGSNDTTPADSDMEETGAEEVQAAPGEGGGEPASGGVDKMTLCETKKPDQPAEYTYYFAEEALYERVDTMNGGQSLRVETPEKVCIKTAGSSVETWACTESTPGAFRENFQGYQEHVNSPVADMMGIECSEVDYDPSVFEVEE